MRRLSVWVLLCCACPSKSTPDAAVATPYKTPTVKCAVVEPAGWVESNAPMPDHVLELLATAPKLRGHLVVREAKEPTVAAASEAALKRTTAQWGRQPDFTLLREDPFGEGRLIAWQWRPQPSAPIERHLIAVVPWEQTVLLAIVDDDGETPEKAILASIATLKCQAR